MSNPEILDHFGYWFYPSKSKHAFGGVRLDIVINEKPTMKHFDPQHVHLSIKAEENLIEPLVIHHPWHFERSFQVCAGLVRIIDRKDKKEEGFTFGGKLTITPQDTMTICTLESTAPILEITESSPLIKMFFEEIEILLAEKRAELLSAVSIYTAHLASADPLGLYIACINALIEKFEHMKHKEILYISQFLNFLNAESKRLKDEELVPYVVQELSDIL